MNRRGTPSRRLPAGWTTGVVRRAGVRYEIVVERRAIDPISEAVRRGRGRRVSRRLVDLMLAIVKPGDLVVDVGAHVGVFSLAAAAAGCHVLAIEASRTNARLLRASAARNGFERLRVVHAAASSRRGTLCFHASGPWGHVVGPRDRLRSAPTKAVRIDDLLARTAARRPAFVKLDVEGSEIRALRGMTAMLKGAAPPILYESNGHCLSFYRRTPGELMAVLEALGYASYQVERGRLVRVRSHELQPQTVVDYLAVKDGPPQLRGWRVQRGLSFEDRVATLVADGTYGGPSHRGYVARALSRAGRAVLSHPSVKRMLERLRQDADQRVRAAARALTPTSSSPPPSRPRSPGRP
jgi:FkbM family methyltransferase